MSEVFKTAVENGSSKLRLFSNSQRVVQLPRRTKIFKLNEVGLTARTIRMSLMFSAALLGQFSDHGRPRRWRRQCRGSGFHDHRAPSPCFPTTRQLDSQHSGLACY